MKREVIPQLMFVAACAGAVFTYVATHIDEIKEKQKVSDDVMSMMMVLSVAYTDLDISPKPQMLVVSCNPFL